MAEDSNVTIIMLLEFNIVRDIRIDNSLDPRSRKSTDKKEVNIKTYIQRSKVFKVLGYSFFVYFGCVDQGEW